MTMLCIRVSYMGCIVYTHFKYATNVLTLELSKGSDFFRSRPKTI